MRGKFRLNDQKGFSLVELMIVVGIIGVLATIAVPKFQSFQAKARAAEAKNMLNQIYTLQEAYHIDENKYAVGNTKYGSTSAGGTCTRPAWAESLGFTIQPCHPTKTTQQPRFAYFNQNATNAVFESRATTGAGDNNLVCPGGTAVEYSINESRAFTRIKSLQSSGC